jgi:hypothetical protein
MYTLSVGAMFKNEAHILDEWIQHYLFHGFEHFYLINDNSTDDFMPIIEKYKEHVTLFNNTFECDSTGRQVVIYSTYFKPILHETEWIAIVDLDEFVYSPYYIDVKHVVKKYDNYSQIIIDWNFFGSNGHIKQPEKVVESFTKRSIPYKNYKNKHSWKSSTKTKAIFKSNKMLSFSIHKHLVEGHEIHLKNNETKSAELIINHYAIQSFDWFMKVKGTRGDADNFIGIFERVKQFSRNEEMFRDLDINEVEDLRLAKQNKNAIKFI